ncbi:hypothetical protein WDW89_01180, partial [Deltaproteobacteria bacterium TL4]
LQSIANPSTITSTTERERFDKLRQRLLEESQKGNMTAGLILSAANMSLPKAGATTIQTENIKSVLQQIAAPASITSPVDRERMTKLHDSLLKASQGGDELASGLLAVNKSTTNSEVQKLGEKLKEAQLKGESTAASVLASLPEYVSLPASNRIQAVTPEELQEVKQMWKENYNNMEVPEGMSGTRNEWIKDDIEKISNLTSLLTSQDQEKVNQGLSEVANILPFLLVGGFSKSEIVSYLSAKQEAAKEVLQSITNEEETKVTVETRHTQAAQTMAANVETPTISMSTPSFDTANIITPQVSNEILAMVNIKIPRMRDIARFETMTISKDKSKMEEVKKVRETLQSIANPSTITSTTERERFDKLRQRLLEESQKGNMTADIVLLA